MGRKKSTKPAKWPEAEYGLDNTYCYEERIHHIQHMLERRYGEVIRTTPLRLELQMTVKEFEHFRHHSWLFRAQICQGSYLVKDVATAIVEYL